jgi:Methyltransferase domain
MSLTPHVSDLLRSAVSRSATLQRLILRATTLVPPSEAVASCAGDGLGAGIAAVAAVLEPERVAVFDYPYRQEPAVKFSSIEAILRRFDEQMVARWSRVSGLREWIDTIPLRDAPSPVTPVWENDWLPPADALSLALLLVEHRPAVYLEVGSGTSTKFARSVITHFSLPTRIVSIDPHPRAEIDSVCDEIVRKPLEDAGADRFAALGQNDLLFFDGSHRSFPGSDVTRFFLEILPLLRSGVVWGVHDVFLPYDYPQRWCREQRRYYNEQYLLASYLLGGGGRDEVVMANAYAPQAPGVRDAIPDVLGGTHAEGAFARGGGCFWMRRR